MYDIELVREILRQILGATQTITRRFAPITSPEDFVVSPSHTCRFGKAVIASGSSSRSNARR